jgi:hypothetical protein
VPPMLLVFPAEIRLPFGPAPPVIIRVRSIVIAGAHRASGKDYSAGQSPCNQSPFQKSA